MNRWISASLLGFSIIFPLSAEGPPADLLDGLTSESYPERIESQRELGNWAKKAGDSGIAWLLDSGANHDHPEVRGRALAVLREQVMRKLDEERPGFIGITMIGSQMDHDGERLLAVTISSVQDGSPADQAGLRRGDAIVALDGERWTEGETPDQLARKVGAMKPGREIRLSVLRDGEEQEFSLELAPRPWAAGEWGEVRQFGMVPFAGRFSLEEFEQQQRENAFKRWLEEQLEARSR